MATGWKISQSSTKFRHVSILRASASLVVIPGEGRKGHFVTNHSGDIMASVTWATKVSTKWVDQIDGGVLRDRIFMWSKSEIETGSIVLR